MIKNSYHTISSSSEIDISGGVISHHLLAHEIIEQFFQEISASSSSFDTIILLSPDHYRRAAKMNVKFLLSSNNELMAPLVSQGLAKINRLDVFTDHGVTTPLMFINRYLSQKEIIPVLVSPEATEDEMKILVKTIAKRSPRTVIIASVDFSHYLPKNILLFHDAYSLRVFNNFETNNFPQLDVDSWQALYGLRYFAQLKKAEKITVLNHKTSFDYLSEPLINLSEDTNDEEAGTSYFSLLMTKGENIKNQSQTILIAGDTTRSNSVYSFKKIKKMFRGVELIFGNILNQSRFVPVTDFSNCSESYLYQEDEILFLGADLVEKNSSCFKDLLREIKTKKSEDSSIFLIVIPSWGEEITVLPDKYQQQTAHELIEAGADLILGYQPQIVQGIEEYHHKLIFYSLGNFLFKNDLSAANETFVVLGLEKNPQQVIIYLIPLHSQQHQLSFLINQEQQDFLNNLANLSSPALQLPIKNGIIYLNIQ